MLTLDEAAVVRAAFDALRSGLHPTLPDLATRSGLAPNVADEVVGAFVHTGRAQLNGEGPLIGVVGLTTETTGHRLMLDGTKLFTWCGFDAVGIPAALRADAAVFTTCGYCQGPIEVYIDAGSAPQGSPIRGWLPLMENCENVRAEFCPDANLFCDAEHLKAWRAAAGRPDGLPMDLDALANLGRGQRGWGAVRAEQ